MIAFATLFLGLAVGVQPVEVVVGDEVAVVEILLNSRRLATIRGAPWRADCDFGDELAPGRLEAVAYDGEQRELGRARQLLNLPHPPAELSFVLDRDPEAGWIGRLAWESTAGDRPRSVSVSFDGRPLAVDDPRHIPLPPHDPTRQHLFQAEVEFNDNVVSQLTAVFGGTFTDEVSSELTAIPFLAPKARWKPPPAEAMRGWFVKHGEPLAVAAVERGPSEVVIVLGTTLPFNWARPEAKTEVPLRANQTVRFLRPVATPTPGAETTFNLYPMSPEFTPADGGLYWLLTQLRRPEPGRGDVTRFADAVAVAALAAYERQRRRAVVLLLGDETDDASLVTAEQSRRYLERLKVPFFLWTAMGRTKPIEGWGVPVSIADRFRLAEAFHQVNKVLDRQWIVWLEGRHLPQEITLSPAAGEITLATAR